MKHGYQADESWITRELNNNETSESLMWSHSERLAIAFNLIQQPIPARIQIVNNLRICEDCREFKKYHVHILTKLFYFRYCHKINC